MDNKKYCHPLTIADSKSRYLFTAKGHYGGKFKPVKEEFTKVFRKYGLPKQIHTDNGVPFGAVAAIQRFTRLSYWFLLKPCTLISCICFCQWIDIICYCLYAHNQPDVKIHYWLVLFNLNIFWGIKTIVQESGFSV